MSQALRIIEGSRRTWAGLGQDGLDARGDTLRAAHRHPADAPDKERCGSCRHGVAG